MDTPQTDPTRKRRRLIWRIILFAILLLAAYHLAVQQLYQAIDTGNVTKAEWLMRFGVGPNVLYADPHPTLPLHTAVRRGDVEMVRAMLRYHANANASSPGAHTSPLYDAVFHHQFSTPREPQKYMAIAKMLVDRHCDINQRGTWMKQSPLAAATSRYGEDLEMIDFLLNHGADPNCFDAVDHTALSYAVDQGKLETVKRLLDHGAHINMLYHFGDGMTVLDMAIDENEWKQHPTPDNREMERMHDVVYRQHFPGEDVPKGNFPAVIAYLRAHGAKTAKELGAAK